MKIIAALKSFGLILLISPGLSSCTSGLLKESEGIKIISHKNQASILSAYRSDDGNSVYVCINLSEQRTGNYSNQLFSFPINDTEKLRSLEIGNKTHYFYYTPEKHLTDKCVVTKNKLDIIKFTIDKNPTEYYRQADQQSVNKILDSRSGALYVAIRNDRPVQIGYMSSVPVIDAANIIHAPIENIYSNDTVQSRKPYLYLAIPVTAAADIVIAGIGVVAVTSMAFGYIVAGP